MYERVPAIKRFLETAGTGITFEQLLISRGDDPKDIPPQSPREPYQAAIKTRARSRDGPRGHKTRWMR
jgi:hypothetical protein